VSDCNLLDERRFLLDQAEGHLFCGTTVALRREVFRDSFTTRPNVSLFGSFGASRIVGIVIHEYCD
jgi:hypothetical protein